MRFGFVPVPTGGTPFVPGQWDLLFNGTWPSTGAGGGLTYQTLTPLNSYTALYFWGLNIPNIYCAGINQPYTSGPTFWCTSVNSKQGVVILPCSTRRINISVFLGFSGAQSGNGVIVWGLTGPQPVPGIRQDGRAWPQGCFGTNTYQTSGSPYTVLGQPIAPFHYLIKAASLRTVGSYADLQCTVGGQTVEILGLPSVAAGIGYALTQDFGPQGILCDPAPSGSIVMSFGNQAGCGLIYDIVA